MLGTGRLRAAGNNHSSMGRRPSSSRASILYLLRSGRRACTCFLQKLQCARHLFCLLRISLDNFCMDTRVVSWCSNNSVHNGEQQHTKNGDTQLHDNSVASPSGASQLECKLLCWNYKSHALLAHETHKMLLNPVTYTAAEQQQNLCTSPRRCDFWVPMITSDHTIPFSTLCHPMKLPAPKAFEHKPPASLSTMPQFKP